VGIDPQRDGDVGVTDALDKTRVAVADIVEADRGQTGTLDDHPKPSGEHLRMQRLGLWTAYERLSDQRAT
jgi:hypothetical protein